MKKQLSMALFMASIPLSMLMSAFFVSPNVAYAQTLAADVINTTTLELSNEKPTITRVGGGPVVINGKAKINRRLDLRGPLVNKKGYIVINDTVVPKKDFHTLGTADLFWAALYARNIILPDGGKVDGVDVSALAQKVNTLEDSVDAFTDTNTTYTAGSGLSLNGTQFSLTGYDNLLTVGSTGAQYTSISDAIAAINAADDAGYYNRYLIWVAPGTYLNSITLPDYVTLKGVNKDEVLIADYVADDGAVITTGISSVIDGISVQAAAADGATTVNAINVPTTSSVDIHDVHITLNDPPSTTTGINANTGTFLRIYNSFVEIGDAITQGIAVYSQGTFEMYNTTLKTYNAATSVGLALDPGDVSETNNIVKDSQIIALGQGGEFNATDCIAVTVDGDAGTLRMYNTQIQAQECETNNIGVLGYSGINRFYNSSILSDGDAIAVGGGGAIFSSSSLYGGATNGGGVLSCLNSADAESSTLLDSDCLAP